MSLFRQWRSWQTLETSQCASKSFTQRIDEIGQLTRAFEGVVIETHKILQESNNVSHTLIEASEQFKVNLIILQLEQTINLRLLSKFRRQWKRCLAT